MTRQLPTPGPDAEGTGEQLVPASWLSRRRFLGRVSTVIGAAALEGCGRPEEKIIPYVQRPPELVPGVGQYYATSTTRAGYGVGLLVESHTGRPTKIEGHPAHPASLGRALVQEQAEILTLYDPDRAKGVQQRDAVRSWPAFRAAFGPLPDASLVAGTAPPGRELLLLQPTASPLVGALLERVRERRPRAEIFFDPSSAPVARWQAASSLFGEVLEPQYRFERAQVVLALDANFLAGMPMSIRWAHDFASQRDASTPSADLNRLYWVGSLMNVTSATADHYLAVRGSELGPIAAALLHALSQRDAGASVEAARPDAERAWQSLTEQQRTWLSAVVKDLWQHRGRALVIAGDQQPAAVHACCMALNELLGNVGETVSYTPSPQLGAGTAAYSLEGFLRSLDGGDVAAAFVLGGNPAYGSPPELAFLERWRKARQRVYLSLYENETASGASWLLSARHFLEAWGAARAYDGTLSMQQPLIRPLYGGSSVEEVLAVLAGLPAPEGRALLRDHFIAHHGDEQAFAEALSNGVVPGSAHATQTPSLRAAALAEALHELLAAPRSRGLELALALDPRVEDGRLSNNRWLLELPEPVSKLVWDNAALLAPQTATELGLKRGDVIEISKQSRSIRAPVLPSPGQAPGTIGIWLGWGRRGAESGARGVGVDVAPLRERDDPWLTRDVQVRATGEHHQLVTTQREYSMHGRDLALHRTLEEWRNEPDFARPLDTAPVTLMPERSTGAPQWGMTIDLSRCTGCSACVIACQAENNIPTVGKEMVAMGREMQWLRIDAYREGPEDHPKQLLQPMLCQHCEKAPCEYVCPVNATVHSADGLNEMIYNRCVGTRFCSNNCPYKVRRFNFYDYNEEPPEVVRMVFNPDVTVRARGVMEKCSYCVQRIRRAQIDAKLEQRPLREGDVRTACQQTCPTDAIVFGLVSDPTSQVSQRYRNPRTYAVLNDLGTQPRTRYLARIDNTNDELGE